MTRKCIAVFLLPLAVLASGLAGLAQQSATEAPAGFKGGDVSYPKGELRTFAFSKKPLSVYEDQVILRMELSALPSAPLGPQHIPPALISRHITGR